METVVLNLPVYLVGTAICVPLQLPEGGGGGDELLEPPPPPQQIARNAKLKQVVIRVNDRR